MEKFEYKDYKVSVWMDAMEYAKEFFEIPDGAVLDEEDATTCAGHAEIEEKEIYIFVPEFPTDNDLWAVVAHEIGHVIEFHHDPVPVSVSIDDPMGEEKAEVHERRAEFFENFFLDVIKISQTILNIKDSYHANKFYDQHIPNK